MGQKLTSGWFTHAAERHLCQACRVMARLTVEHGTRPLADCEFQPFQTLPNSIICQQLSATAADTIERPIQAIVLAFTPAGFLAVPTEALRAAGLSSGKARYILELTQRASDGRLNLEAMQEVPDADVIAALLEPPGVGRWTAGMFLIFGLDRPDVLSLSAAGLQRAVRLLFWDDAKLEHMGQSLRPFCSVASWYLWRHLN